MLRLCDICNNGVKRVCLAVYNQTEDSSLFQESSRIEAVRDKKREFLWEPSFSDKVVS